ncbi:hypothetical protein D6810_00735 [Candidatus Dojkabacteria bacterium]|uniref:Uncharacterized protein n=1 Tax=Candidatus Dojkabacteria bacterium TaxID=2099670 RepID=A0A3M0Z3H6_9BACT|nr:MAG: hypothetical protein D6810_00735 [Candidatus Dojkabacteria bacterium]
MSRENLNKNAKKTSASKKSKKEKSAVKNSRIEQKTASSKPKIKESSKRPAATKKNKLQNISDGSIDVLDTLSQNENFDNEDNETSLAEYLKKVEKNSSKDLKEDQVIFDDKLDNAKPTEGYRMGEILVADGSGENDWKVAVPMDGDDEMSDLLSEEGLLTEDEDPYLNAADYDPDNPEEDKWDED